MAQSREPNNTLQNWIRNIAIALAVLSLAAVIGLLVWRVQDESNIKNEARDTAGKRAATAANEIDSDLKSMQTFTEGIVAELEKNSSDEDIRPYLREKVAESQFGPGGLTLTVAYNPGSIPTEIAENAHEELGREDKERIKKVSSELIYSPYAIKDENGQPQINYIEVCYNYTLPKEEAIDNCNGDLNVDTSWYSEPAEKATVNGPYWGTATQNWWAGYGSPFSTADSKTGIATTDLTLATLQKIVSEAPLDEEESSEREQSWYGFIISDSRDSGAFLSHPIDEYVTERRNIAEFPIGREDVKDSNKRNLNTSVIKSVESIEGLQLKERVKGFPSVAGPIDHKDPVSGKEFWVFFAPIEFSDDDETKKWWLGISQDKEEIFLDNKSLDRLQKLEIGIAMTSAALLILLVFLLSGAYKGSAVRIWIASALSALVLLSGIAYLWIENAVAESTETGRNIVLSDHAVSSKLSSDLARTIGSAYAGQGGAESEAVQIPTGVFVQSIEFSSSNNVTVNGIIWQKVSDDADKKIKALDAVKDSPAISLTNPGFVILESDSATITGAYERKDGDNTIYGWNFNASVRQAFDYNEYPFDREDVWIRLRYRDFDKPVILTPDLSAYPDKTSPESQPGLEQSDFVMEGWSVIGSFFSYRKNAYNTNFGIPSFLAKEEFPELYFNVSLKRNFLNTFVSNMIPIIVVATLLFLVLLTTTAVRREDETDENDRFQFSTANVLAFCAALFFVVIVSHTNMRNNLSAQGIIYLEWLYFVMYIAILLVAINAIFTKSDRIRQSFLRDVIMSDRQNLIIKPLYWPILLGLLLVITVIAFW